MWGLPGGNCPAWAVKRARRAHPVPGLREVRAASEMSRRTNLGRHPGAVAWRPATKEEVLTPELRGREPASGQVRGTTGPRCQNPANREVMIRFGL